MRPLRLRSGQALLWLKQFQRGRPDDLREAARRCICTDCLKRGERIAKARLKLVRNPPTGEALPLPTDQQWREGLKWQRR